MIGRYFLSFLTTVVMLSCSKEKSNTYIVNAGKMIEIRGGNWNNFESQFRDKTGYQYIPTPTTFGLKAKVDLPAFDDGNRVVKGKILFSIAIDNRIIFSVFNTDPIVQSTAYAMMLNYHNASLQSMTNITSSTAAVTENGIWQSTTVSSVLSKLTNGQAADELEITYRCAQGQFKMYVFRQSDGRFIFSYIGS